MQPFLVSVEERAPGRFAVVVSGEIDMATAPDLQNHLVPLIREKTIVAADISRVAFMDSSGLHALNHVTQMAKDTDSKFRVCAPSWEVQQLFDLVDAHLFFDIWDDVRTALSAG